MTRTTNFVAAALLVATAIAGAGCGDDGDDGTAKAPPKARSTTTSSSPKSSESSRKPRKKAKSSTKREVKRVAPDTQRKQLAASERLAKQYGITLRSIAKATCVNIKADPRLTRMIAGKRCKKPRRTSSKAKRPRLGQRFTPETLPKPDGGGIYGGGLAIP